MPPYRHYLLLWLWQRLEKAQVSTPRPALLRPSSHPILRSYASRTAEDLTATSRRLARYESLLNQIFPLVSPEVRALIEDARDNVSLPMRHCRTIDPMAHLRSQDGSNASNASEAADNDYGVPPPRLESGLVGPGGRIILPLPVPSPHVPAVSRSSTSSGTYEPMSVPVSVPVPAVIPPSIPGGSAGSLSSIPTPQRLSPDSNTLTRLPSITSDGILLETGRIDQSPPPPPLALVQGGSELTAIFGQDRLGAPPTSPSGRASLGGWSNESLSGGFHADTQKRKDDAPTILPWLKSTEATTVRN